MKRFTLFFLSWVACLLAMAQGTLPTFSTEDAPVWYQVKFTRGGNYLTDKGSGNTMATNATGTSANENFILVGNQDAFTMKSEAGNYVCWNGSKYATTSEQADATTLRLIEGSGDNFEIQREGSDMSMNQVGQIVAGQDISEWDAGDTNNQLTFVQGVDPTSEPVFSTSDREQYYLVKFLAASSTTCMGASRNEGEEYIRLYAPSLANDMQWKLIGTKDNFQFQNKEGKYAIVGDKPIKPAEAGATNTTPLTLSDTEDPNGFKLQESSNTNNGEGWEIISLGKTGSENAVNMFGQPDHNNTLGFWQSGDANNVVNFVDPSTVEVADYEVTGITGYVPENNLTLWYTEPATTATLYSGGQGYSNWMEYSLPLGDGQFGASLFGGVYKDEVQFNEKTLWSGHSTDNTTASYGRYENFGSVFAQDISDDFGMTEADGPHNYYRQLDLTTATGKVHFTSPDGSVTYTREYIASNPAHVVAARYTASESGKISLRFTLKKGGRLKASVAYEESGEASFSGQLDVVSYNARMKVVPTGGTMSVTSAGIEVRNADEVLLLLAGATDYDPYQESYISNTAGLADKVQARINDAAAKTWAELYQAHLEDYQSYFGRVDFQLEGTKNEVPTNELVDSYNSGAGTDALMLEQLYFAYGRYLEIASSRGVDLPSNLQGIWSNMDAPAWNADIHANINVQMNYWPAEPTNLSEMHVPFLHYIWNMAENHSEWKGWAAEQGQNRGWTCFTENNIFGGVGGFMHNYVIANAWYCTHLWQHYRYTLDKEYLKKVFPAMLSATQFWIDRLELASDGTYEAPDEYSPEHGPSAEDGTAHAQQLVYDLFSNTLSAIEVLGDEANVPADDMEKLQDRFAKLDNGLHTETYTGNWGTDRIASGTTILKEWKYSSYTATTEGQDHRHMSHLMCMYPFSQVHPGTALFDAAVNSMKLRGDGATGWSMGWKMNLWARALDGDHARTILNNALAHSNGGSGVFYNLFDSHAPFQIDGNFGACAGISEMLMQSNADTIRVLPALPSAWTEGHVTGLKAVKDFTVSTWWKDGKATRIVITNNQGQQIPVLYSELAKAKVFVDNVPQTDFAVDERGVALLGGNAGTTYVFDFDGTYTSIAQATGNSSLTLSVDGRKVSFLGADNQVKDVKVYDLSGRRVQRTSKTSFEVSRAAGSAVVIEVTDAQGNVNTFKAALQ